MPNGGIGIHVALIETILLYALAVVASFVILWTACSVVIATFTDEKTVPLAWGLKYHFKDAFMLAFNL